MRHVFFSTLALASALLAAAPAASAQSAQSAPSAVSLRASPPLAPHVGSPVAFRVGLPKGWEVERNEYLLAAADGDMVAGVMVLDLIEHMRHQGNELPVSDAEARRIMTSLLMDSDSLLYALMDRELKARGDKELEDAVVEIRSLGGQRAVYVSGRGTEDGLEPVRLEMYMTVRDGIMYMLLFMAPDAGYAEHQALFDRVRESLVLAPGAEAPASR